jgi:hypothetical protein
MDFITVLQKFDSPLWGFHLIVPNEIARTFLDEGVKRVVCTLGGVAEFQCALMPKGDGSHFINVNKKLREKLKLKLGDVVAVSLRKDESPYGLPMPEEMQELLELDDDGNRLFHDLTPGKQRTLLYIVGSAKTSETRLKRAVVVIDHLKANSGKINFKQLNEELKEANRGLL